MWYSSDNEKSDQNPKAEGLVAPSATPSLQSLFKIPKRKFTHPTTTASPTPVVFKKCPVTVAIILCEDDRYLSITKTNHTVSVTNGTARNYQYSTGKPAIAKNFSRQINQTIVLLKSIAILSKFQVAHPQQLSSSCVEILLLSDKPTHYKAISREIKSKWSVEFQQLFKITHVPVRYPHGSAWMRKLFRPCATLRLFLAELLPDHDSAIYVDTDVIFFQSVQALWAQFGRFNNSHDHDNTAFENKTKKIAAMAPCLFHYGSSANSVPYFGSSGLNAGIMLMNLTGMRMTQWTNKIRMVTTMFQDKIKLADQDILNIYFHFFPEELHMLSCDWNFRPFQCRKGSYCADAQLSHGISALHGNALSFTSQGPEPLFRAIYQVFHWTKLDSNFSIVEFVDRLETTLLKVEETTHNSDCKRYGGFNVVALNRYYNIVERIEQDRIGVI
ncbi:Glucoside xylosyltransferase 1 [Orchesella cincta]|uniref:UDP-D-xylose:beta-D-glucoside alpha-1,3-D-xylosyltransferase n=1 Tax=Orchesella cincta TaxID=48709 RepID=A0A1D2NEB5_ORCCI|nr:Glucoside xylosyltransferase 1 [Orchesella cincta]